MSGAKKIDEIEAKNGAGDKPELLSKKDILSLDDRQYEIFYVEEWDGHVPLTGLDAWQQSQYEQSLIEASTDAEGEMQIVSKMEGADVRLAAMGIRNPGNAPWFTEEELRVKSGAAIKKIANRLRELSGMDAKSRKAAKGN